MIWTYPEKVSSCSYVRAAQINFSTLVIVYFRPVGSAPLLKQTKFKISSHQKFQAIADFLYRQLTSGSSPEAPSPPTASPTSMPVEASSGSGGMAERNQTGACPAGLFLYVNSSFAPAGDEVVGNLFACFAVDNTLIVNYSLTPAWG